MGDERERATKAQVDINSIRRENLRRLIAQAKTLAAFANLVDVNPDYLSSIVADGATRNAGASVMRRIEAALKLPMGSLDFPEEQSMAAAMVIQALSENDKQQVFDFIRYKIERSEALVTGEHAASYMKMIDGLKSDMARRKKEKDRK